MHRNLGPAESRKHNHKDNSFFYPPKNIELDCNQAKEQGTSTFFIAWHLAVSENPIILSGEQILIKGKLDSSAIFAAKAVFPLWGGPETQDKHNEKMRDKTALVRLSMDLFSVFRPSFRGTCIPKWPFPLCTRNTLTPSTVQSPRWRKWTQLFENTQTDLPQNQHKRGCYTFCRTGTKATMCLYFGDTSWNVCMPLLNMISAGTVANSMSIPRMPSKYWQR